MSNQSDLAKSAAGFNGDPLSIDTANNRVGIGTSSPSNPITIDAANALGSTFTGTTAGEGIRVRQTSYTADNYVSLIEAPYVNTASQPAVRIGAKFNGGGSSLAFGTTNNYASGITNTAMTIDSSGNVGIGTSTVNRKLEISGNNNGGAKSNYIRITDTDTSATANNQQGGIEFYTSDSGNENVTASIENLYAGSGAGSELTFNTAPNGSSGVSERMRIGSSGNITFGSFNASGGSVGVLFDIGGGTSETEIQTSVNGTATRTHYKFINNNGAVGTITTSGTSTAYNTSSDHRLKENVTDVTDGITRVKQLEPKRFNFIADADTTVDGFLAHQAQAVVPEAVTGTQDAMRDEEYEVTPAVLDEDGNEVTPAVMGTRSVPVYQGIDQSKLVPLLTAALKEAITKIETLETEMTSVKARLDALEGN